jgi:DNA-binding response OmpR family regulator
MCRVLIIDDQPYMGEVLGEDLGEDGHEVRCVGDSAEVMDALQQFRPDIVLLDLFLGGFEGWSLLSKIKQEDPVLPVLIVTAYDTYKEDPRAALADGYVIKNFETDELKSTINATLNQSPH